MEILDRNEIILNPQQQKMLISGWDEDTFNNSKVEKITYMSDGLKVKGYVATPLNQNKTKYPILIWNRGGYHNKGAIDHFTAHGIYGQLASWGFVVLASQYRGNDGGEGKDEIGGSDVNDIINLLNAANEISVADTNSVGIEGWSRGAMMTFQAITKIQNVKCVILSGAITDMLAYAASDENIYNFYKKQLGENVEELLKERSAINFVDKLPASNYLIMHGGNDETIPVTQSIELVKKLTERNLNYRFIIYEQGDHFLKNVRKEVEEERKKWLKKYLI